MMPAKLKISWPGGAWVAVIRLAVWALLGAAAAMSLAMLSTPPANAGSNAVVIMYHRFGETKYPSTSVTLEQFEAHLDELKSSQYTVLPLAEILAALAEGKPLPDRTVGLSIDDAFFSLYAEGWPRLKAAGFPFTLFIATDPIDQGTFGYMNWDQIREMSRAGVTIGSQTASHLHMPKADPARNREELERSNKRFEEELGRGPLLFAYPYGESSTAVQTVVRETGFKAAFGQHSGAIGGGGCHAPGVTALSNGMLSILLDPGVFADRDYVDSETSRFADWVSQSTPADLERPVQLRGEPERKTEHERRKNGITLDDNTWQQIVSTAENLGITR